MEYSVSVPNSIHEGVMLRISLVVLGQSVLEMSLASSLSFALPYLLSHKNKAINLNYYMLIISVVMFINFPYIRFMEKRG